MDALNHEATSRLVDRALASPGLERLVMEALESRLTAEVTDRALHSLETQRAVEYVASSPELRSASCSYRPRTLAEELVSGLRRRALKEPTTAPSGGSANVGLQTSHLPESLPTRAVGLAIDVLLAQIIFLTGAALIGSRPLVGDLRPAWLVAARGRRVGTRLGHLLRAVLDGCGTDPGDAPHAPPCIRSARPSTEPGALRRSLLRAVAGDCAPVRRLSPGASSTKAGAGSTTFWPAPPSAMSIVSR